MRFARLALVGAACTLAACQALEPGNTIEITVSPETAELTVGGTQQFVAEVTGADDDGVAWSVSDAAVASISASGLLTAIGAGEIEVTAVANADPDKSATATATITVNATTLTSGTPVTGIAGSANSSRHYVIVVGNGASQLTVTTTGGTGDADLYLRAGTPPTTVISDCDSETSTSSESCTISNPAAGPWHVLVYGYSAYANVTLTATVGGGGGGGTTPGFTIGTSASTASVAPGASTTLTLTATRTGGFTGSIALTATGLPTGVTASFSPSTLTSGQTTSTLTLTAAATAATGTFTLTLRGNSTGQPERTAAVAVTVGGGTGGSTVNMIVSSDKMTVGRGQYTWGTVGVTSGSYSGATAVAFDGLPAGVTVEWRSSMEVGPSSDSIVFTGDYHRRFRLVSAAGTSIGTTQITVRAFVPGNGNPTSATTLLQLSIVEPQAAGNATWSQLALGGIACGRRTDQKTYCWGGLGQSGDGTLGNSFYVPAVAVLGKQLTWVGYGAGHGCGVESGKIWCWGGNSMGTLGDGGAASGRLPVQVSSNQTFATVGVGASFACGLTTAGAAYCWGAEFQGALGNGTIATTNFDYETTPVPVLGGHVFGSISVGHTHTCGLKADGSAYCWGRNSNGQLGDGTTTDRSQPVPVSGGLTFAKISAGQYNTCGVTSAGKGYCWGSYRYVGDSSIPSTGEWTEIETPRAIPGTHVFTDISAGWTHSCGITTSGAVYCWGDNFYGQIGNGTSGTSAFARNLATVSGGHAFSRISAGDQYSCGVTTAEVLYCWGRNYAGKLGDGTTTDRLTPTKVLTF